MATDIVSRPGDTARRPDVAPPPPPPPPADPLGRPLCLTGDAFVQLPYHVALAAYDRGRDQLLVAPMGARALHVIDPESCADSLIDLPGVATSVTPGPAGTAIVVHGAGVSLVDLATARVRATQPFSARVEAVAVDALGRAQIVSAPTSSANEKYLLSTIDFQGGAVRAGPQISYRGTIVASPDRRGLYYLVTGLTGGEVMRFDVTGAVPVQVGMSSAPYAFNFCAKLFAPDDRRRLFGGCASVYRASDTLSDQPLLDGLLEGVDQSHPILDVDVLASINRIGIIQGGTSPMAPDTPDSANASLRIHDVATLGLVKEFPLPDYPKYPGEPDPPPSREDAGPPPPSSRGRQVFIRSDGSRYYVLVQRSRFPLAPQDSAILRIDGSDNQRPRAPVDAAAAPDAGPPDTPATDAARDVPIAPPDAASPRDLAPRTDAVLAPAPDLTPVAARPDQLVGTALLMGEADHSGIVVELVGTSFRAVTSASGAFTMGPVPDGRYVMRLTKGDFVETVPVLDVKANGGFVTNGTDPPAPLVPIELSRARRLFDGPQMRRAVVANDTRLLATWFADMASHLHSARLTGGDDLAISDTAAGWTYPTPDAARVIYFEPATAAGRWDVVSARLDGSARVVIGHDATSSMEGYFGPGGRSFLYGGASSGTTGSYALRSTPVDQEAPSTLVTATASFAQVVQSPDRRYVATLNNDTTFSATLSLIDLQTGTRTVSQSVSSFTKLRFTSDGKTLVFGGQSVSAVPVAGGRPFTFYDSEGDLVISPDQRLVVVKPLSGALYVGDLATGERRRITTEEFYGYSTDIRFYPDSSRVVYKNAFALKSASTSTIDVRNVSTTVPSFIEAITIDGTKLFARVEGGSAPAGDYLYDLQTEGTPTALTRASLRGFIRAPGETHLALASGAYPEDLAVFRLSDGMRVFSAVTSDVPATHFSADGGRMLFVDEAGTGRLLETDTGRTLAAIPNARVRDGAFSPDGTGFVVTSGDVVACGSVQTGRVVPIGRYFAEPPYWLPSGHLVFRALVTGALQFKSGLYAFRCPPP